MPDQKIAQVSKWRPLRIVIPIIGAELTTALVVAIAYFGSAGIFASQSCQELAVIFCSIAVFCGFAATYDCIIAQQIAAVRVAALGGFPL